MRWRPARPTARTRRVVARVTPWALLALVVALAVWRPPAAAFPPILAFPIIGAIVGFLGKLFGIFKGAALVVLQAALYALRAVVVHLGNAIMSVAHWAAKLLPKLFEPLKWVWGPVLRPFFGWLVDRVTALVKWLRRIFDPIFRVLDRVLDWTDRVYDMFIRPILDVIDRARQIVRVLSGLGVEWAEKLDEVLATLERKLVEPILVLRSYLNRVIDVLDRVITFDYLFQRAPMLQTLVRDLVDWTRMFWNGQVTGLTPEQKRKLAQRKYPPIDPELHARQLTEFYSTGGGPLAPVIREYALIFLAVAGL